MPRTSERGGPATRARIVEASHWMFLERGYDAVTVAEVAREAGVSSVTVFKHFPRKEDLFFDRTDEAIEVLRSAVHDRAPGVDIPTSLRRTADAFVESGHPLSGVDPRSLPFFRTVAGSPSLIARAREISAELQAALADEIEQASDFEGDRILFAAFFMAGYGAVMVGTARRRLAGDDLPTATADHRVRLERFFDALAAAFAPTRVDASSRDRA
jgi:AcrR family transcriptional regulator